MKHLKPWRQSLSHRDFFSDFDSLFDQFLTNSGAELALDNKQGSFPFSPHIDLREKEDYFLISADLPGLTAEEISIDVNDGTLSISGERKSEHEEKDKSGKVHRQERRYGSCERSFTLPPNIDEENIQARHENGVLEVMVPRAATSKKKNIKVEASKSGLFSKLLGDSNKKSVN